VAPADRRRWHARCWFARRPPRMESSVDLPLPDGPSTASTSPGRASPVTPLRIVRSSAAAPPPAPECEDIRPGGAAFAAVVVVCFTRYDTSMNCTRHRQQLNISVRSRTKQLVAESSRRRRRRRRPRRRRWWNGSRCLLPTWRLSGVQAVVRKQSILFAAAAAGAAVTARPVLPCASWALGGISCSTLDLPSGLRRTLLKPATSFLPSHLDG